jgi:hypothetical protein
MVGWVYQCIYREIGMSERPQMDWFKLMARDIPPGKMWLAWKLSAVGLWLTNKSLSMRYRKEWYDK